MGKRGLAAEQVGRFMDSKEPGPGVVHPIAKGLAPAFSFFPLLWSRHAAEPAVVVSVKIKGRTYPGHPSLDL